MITQENRTTIQAIVQIFETGGLSKKGYGVVTNLQGDRGGLTYGKHQASITSGSLHGMIKMYTQHPHAQYGAAFLPYLSRLLNADPTLANERAFTDLLRNAGNDPAMHFVQEEYFARQYFAPAEAFCASRGFVQPLTLAVVYDSFIHGSFKRINAGVMKLPEAQWARAYVTARRAWLANSSNPLLRNCVYRPDTFIRMIDSGRWDLALPLTIRGVTIRSSTNPANDFVPPVANPPVPFNNVSAQPLLRKGMRGDDVLYLQDLLIRNGFPLTKDGDFGRATDTVVRAFQASKGLGADGVVGPRTWAVLDDILLAA